MLLNGINNDNIFLLQVSPQRRTLRTRRVGVTPDTLVSDYPIQQVML